MTRVQISLPVIFSEGPRRGVTSDGTPWERSTPCPGCDLGIMEGEAIVKLGGTWYHVDCLKTEQTEDAWLRIAYDIQQRPGQYDVATIRAVIKNLSRMAERGRRSLPFGEDDK